MEQANNLQAPQANPIINQLQSPIQNRQFEDSNKNLGQGNIRENYQRNLQA
jgi:hypothetical protein